MTVVDHILSLGELKDAAEQALVDELALHEVTAAQLAGAVERAERAECRVQELEADLEDARRIIVERNGLYSRSQSELASVRAQLDATRGTR